MHTCKPSHNLSCGDYTLINTIWTQTIYDTGTEDIEKKIEEDPPHNYTKPPTTSVIEKKTIWTHIN